jgi:hypothetical protein
MRSRLEGASAEQGVQARGVEPAVGHACGDRDAAGEAYLAVGQAQRGAVRGGLEPGDRPGHGRDGAKGPWDGKLDIADPQGACFTISSLGGVGGTGFTPIVNAPEVAILGVVRSRMTPVWDGSAFVPRLMLPISLSYDHRVIDGALAARFARYLCHLLEDVRRLVL